MSSEIQDIKWLMRTVTKLLGKDFADVHKGTWVPTPTGFSAVPSGAIYRYTLIGKLCTVFVEMPNNGTSDATTFTIPAPFTAATVTNMNWRASILYAQDNGSQITTVGIAYIASAGTAFTLHTTVASGAWTNANGKRADFILTYEIA
jgi:hypothetical protein